MLCGCARSVVGSPGPGSASVAGRLPAVDVERLPGDERGPFEIENPVDDVGDVADTTEWVKPRPVPHRTPGHVRASR